MTETTKSLPKEVGELYNLETSHQVINLATDALQGCSPEEQARLLCNPGFVNIVNQALADLGECSRQHEEKLFDAISPINRVLAFSVIG